MSASPPSAREPRAAYRTTAAPAEPALRALLDVNVLVALLDADHIHHTRASTWLSTNLDAGWASCVITQNGCIRILSQPGYPSPQPAAQVAARLRAATLTTHHRFIPADESLLDQPPYDTGQLLGHRQVTDAWLLGLAVAHELCFVSFDAALPWRVVPGASARHSLVL